MASATVQIPGVALAETLVLDSTSFMSGNLVNDVRPRFLLHTRVGGYNGPETTVNSYRRDFDWTQPMDPNTPPPVDEVGVVEWRSNSIGRPKTIIKALKQGKTFTLGAFMKVGKFGTRKYFGGIGSNENEGGVKWQETDGTWRCTHATNTDTRVLAVLHSRIATRGTRIEVSTLGQERMDTIVLTALLVLHGEADWKAFTNRPVPSPYSFYQPRLVMPPVPHVTAVTLTLSTNSFLNGLLAVGGQLMYGMKTTGNKTVLSKYTWEQRPRLQEFATIEWQGTTVLGRQRSVLTYRGQKHELDDFMWSSFLGNRLRRFGMPDFLPWVQWIESPPSWTCVSHPGRHPLAILDRRFMTAGTKLEVTLEGLEYLDALVISTLFVVHSPFDWKRPENVRRNTAAADGGPRTFRQAIEARRGRPSGGRTVSENNVPSGSGSRQNEGDHASTTAGPALDRQASASRLSDSRVSRISGISGDSEIPEYSPPPRGMILDYREDGYIDPRPNGFNTPAGGISAMGSRIDLPLTQLVNGITVLDISRLSSIAGAALLAERNARAAAAATTTSLAGGEAGPSTSGGARIEEVHDEPPSYHPPGYESS
ncbi:hypothetical protein FRC00_003888 [Tulasnella sp. 408]|nr:hypothetical protein FRC00_003888 [Tulasnella sp. 408]